MTREQTVKSIIENFRVDTQIEGGELTIAPLGGRQIPRVQELLLTSFRETLARKPTTLVRKLLLDNLEDLPYAVCLVATLTPEGQERDERDVVGTVTLSFSSDTRDEDEALPAPSDAPYLSNMAVLPTCRRRGVARILLGACQELVGAIGGEDIYLHVRVKDSGALGLYEGAGYQQKQADGFIAALFSPQGARMLMRHQLPAPPRPEGIF